MTGKTEGGRPHNRVDVGPSSPLRVEPLGSARRKPPVISDVASRAGVSRQTVSRVLNNHHSVSPRARGLVTRAIEELGYHRNGAARALSTGRSNVVGVLTAGSEAYFSVRATLEGIEAAAHDHGYTVTVARIDHVDHAEVGAALEHLLEIPVSGIIALPPVATVQNLLKRPLPCVVIEAGGDGPATQGVVRVDHVAGARAATTHLLRLGHRTVWHIGGPAHCPDALTRETGWRDTLTTAGVAPPPVLRGDWSARSGYDVGRELLREHPVTAVFAANDQMALGLIRALDEGGRSVPADVAVVGYDDIPEAAYFSPPLTTVRQDFAAVGRQSLSSILEQAQSYGNPVGECKLTPELVVRGSSRLHQP